MQFIILLRGVNVGGRKIKMTELKGCLEDAGFKNVVTILQTGNVILESREKDIPVSTKEIESILTGKFNYPAHVIVITAPRLKITVGLFPFKNIEADFQKYVVFTKNGSEKELVNNCGVLDSNIESVVAGDTVVYWTVKKGFTLDSDFGKFISRMSNKEFITTRNINTLEKIMCKLTVSF